MKLPEETPLILRVTQSLFSLIAMSTAVGGFPVHNGVQAWSPEFSFILLLTFSSWILTMIWCFAVKFRVINAPPRHVGMIFDLIMIIMFFSGGIAAAVSTPLDICHYGIRCGALRASICFTFFTMVSFIGTLVLAYLEDPKTAFDYGFSMTPRSDPPASTTDQIVV